MLIMSWNKSAYVTFPRHIVHLKWKMLAEKKDSKITCRRTWKQFKFSFVAKQIYNADVSSIRLKIDWNKRQKQELFDLWSFIYIKMVAIEVLTERRPVHSKCVWLVIQSDAWIFVCIVTVKYIWMDRMVEIGIASAHSNICPVKLLTCGIL